MRKKLSPKLKMIIGLVLILGVVMSMKNNPLEPGSLTSSAPSGKRAEAIGKISFNFLVLAIGFYLSVKGMIDYRKLKKKNIN